MNKRLLFIFLSLLSFGSIQAQISSATYNYKMVRDEFEQTATLVFNSIQSKFVYKQIEGTKLVLEDEGGYASQAIYSDSAGHVFYRNQAEGKMIERIFCENTAYLINDNFNMAWTLTKKTKNIAGYKCTLAQTSFRGREYNAWFAVDIPYDAGPWKFHGLPGLIMEISDKDQLVYFKLSNLKLADSSSASELLFNYQGKQGTFEDLRAHQLEVWNRINERLRSKAAQMMAENPSLEIEIETPEKPIYTEDFGRTN